MNTKQKEGKTRNEKTITVSNIIVHVDNNNNNNNNLIQFNSCFIYVQT
jgi:hypothetical protein